VIEAPCVNVSGELCSLVRSGDQIMEMPAADSRAQGLHTCTVDPLGRHDSIYLGLANIKSLTTETVQLILRERRRHGPYTDLEDLLHRAPLPLEQARILIRVGALRFTGKSKPQLLWDLTLLHNPASVTADGDLFISKVEEPMLPELHHYPFADAYDELELLGFPLCDPFGLVVGGGGVGDACIARTAPPPPTILKHDMPRHIGKRVTMLGYMVHVKPASTRTGEWMSFGSFIDTAGELWDSTQFPSVAARFPFRGRGVYRLTGVVEEEFGHCSLRTQVAEKLPWKADPRYGEK